MDEPNNPENPPKGRAGRPKGGHIPREVFQAAVRIYRQYPGMPNHVRRLMIDQHGYRHSVSTIHRWWAEGLVDYGYPPIRETLAREGIRVVNEEQVLSRDKAEAMAARMQLVSAAQQKPRRRPVRRVVMLSVDAKPLRQIEDEKARLAEGQRQVEAERRRIEIEKEALKPLREAADRVVVDAAKERAKEATLVMSTLNVVLNQLAQMAVLTQPLQTLAVDTGNKISAMVAGGQLGAKEGLQLMERYSQASWRITSTAHRAMVMMRLHLGEPGEIVKMLPANDDTVTESDVRELVKEMGGDGPLQEAIADLAAGRTTPLATKLLSLQWQRQEGVTGRENVH